MPEVFRCPSCSAPLEFEGKTIQKCRFCQSSVIVPSEMFDKSSANIFDDAFALGNKAAKLAEINREIQAGNKINAIKLFRETFGGGLKEAKDAVEALEEGKSIDISGMQIKPVGLQIGAQNLDAAKKIGYTVGGSILATTVIIALVTIGAIVAVFYFVSRSVDKAIEQSSTNAENIPNFNTLVSQPPKAAEREASIAQEILKFGGDGTGAGKFKDNRSIAVGVEGRIYSADYTGGRIQIFDADGNFQTQILIDANRPLMGLAIDRKNNLFVLQTFDLHRFDAKTGDLLGTTRIDYASDLTVGLDGKIYVPTRSGAINVLNFDGAKIKTIQIPKDSALEEIRQLAIDGAGNFYVLDGKTDSVFKLSPEGKFLTRFGGRSAGSIDKTPKNLFYGGVHDLAVDSQGRVYVSQILRISIFDTNGNFLNDFKINQAFGIAFNDADELFVATRPFVAKFKLSL